MPGPRLTVDEIKRIIICIDNGLSAENTRNLFGYSSSTVCYAYRFVKDVREENKEDFLEALKLSKSKSMAKAVCEACGVDFDKFTREEPEKKEERPTPQPDPNALVVLEKLNTALTDLRDAMKEIAKSQGQILLALQGARQENNAKLDAIKEAVNINGDLIDKDHEAIRVICDSIKGRVNDLKRGNGV